MRKPDLKTFMKRAKHQSMLTKAMFKKKFSWKTLLLCDIRLDRIPASTKFVHPYGICIRESVVFGENCTVMQGVTIGNKHPFIPSDGLTWIRNNVFFGAGSTILGDITIGNNVVIGAGAIVLADVPDGMTIVGTWKGELIR